MRAIPRLIFWLAVGFVAMALLLGSINFAAHQIERAGFRLVQDRDQHLALAGLSGLGGAHAQGEDDQQEGA